MGELNWIFTAITDTIAWNTLPRDLFQRLFRQDLLVASLFRNFLLAERIMRSYNCCPVSSPKLPPTCQHPMWLAWDLALDICLSQLPGIVERNEPFQHSPFFAEQLTAFQVWLAFGSESRNPPEQLPIVLQVLLSQVHRLRALDLLGRFLDLGPWAVNLALSVGIFPYVLKLLQSSARELRPLLVFIWAKILAVDNSCQVDLVRENGHKYFLSVLEDSTMPSQHRMLAAFVLASIVKNYPSGQEAAVKGNIISICLEQLNDQCASMKQWLVICLGRVWSRYDAARWCGVRDSAHEKLYSLLSDESPEVRAAVVYALGTFIWSTEERTDHANTINHSIGIKLLMSAIPDGSPLVRKELVVALQYLVLQFESQFVAVACQFLEEERCHDYSHSPQSLVSSGGWTSPHGLHGSMDGSPAGGDGISPSPKVRRVSSISSVSGQLATSYPVGIPYGSIYTKIWLGLVTLSSDPYPEVSKMARTVIGMVTTKVQNLTQPKEILDAKTSSSFSAPSSPSNKSSFISGESPPANMTLSQRDVSHASNNAGKSQFSNSSRGKRVYARNVPTTIQEDSTELSNAPMVCTEFVDWCSNYLAQPVMMFADESDVDSSSFSEQEWRCLRNARIRKEAEVHQRRIGKAGNMRLDNQVFINRNSNIPTVMRFHPYEPHIIVADKEYCSVWDWEQGLKLSYFPNLHQQMSRITSMDFLNAHDHALLMIGTDDGAVKIWRNYESMDGKEPELVTAWQALTDMLPSTRGAGLVLEWEQDSCLLFASGDVRILRIWDCERELRIKDISTGADSCVTSVSLNHQVFVCGFGDGSIKVYDRRVSSNDCRVGVLREHSGWVVNVHYCQQGDYTNKIISGSVAGDVKVWEPRTSTSIKTYHTSHAMTAMTIHQAADVFACGSVAQFITIYSFLGDNLSLIKYHDGFMGQRIGPISSLTFHPFKMNLAAGSTDSIISVYAADRR